MVSSVEKIAPGLLIAAPLLQDPNFCQTVILMCLHNEEGAMGLVINRPAPFTLRDIMLQLGLEYTIEETQSAMVGGPVALDSGLILYRVEPGFAQREDELVVSEDLRLCPNREFLGSIGAGEGPSQYHMFLGHAGWGSGQLEQEISKGVWIPAPMRLDLIFSVPVNLRWEEALRGEGVVPAQFGSGQRPQA
jgi:putative transcriptional regulator